MESVSGHSAGGTVQLSGQCNFVGESLRDGPTEVERARIPQLSDSRGDLGELESPAVLPTYRSLLGFRSDLSMVRDWQIDYHVGRWIVYNLLCNDGVQKRPVG